MSDDKGSQDIVPVALTPMTMLEMAVSKGAGVETLERLLALQERWQEQQSRRAFEEALANLRADLPPIIKTQTVDFTTKAGRTHYQYEDLAVITTTLSPVMARHGLSFRWRTDSTRSGEVSVTCIVAHREGHHEETTLSGPYDNTGNKNAIQAIGSVVTYLQRYTIKAAVGVAAARDDDAQSASTSRDVRELQPLDGVEPSQPKRAWWHDDEDTMAIVSRIGALATQLPEERRLSIRAGLRYEASHIPSDENARGKAVDELLSREADLEAEVEKSHRYVPFGPDKDFEDDIPTAQPAADQFRAGDGPEPQPKQADDDDQGSLL